MKKITFHEMFEIFQVWFLTFSSKFSAVVYKWHNNQITQQNNQSKIIDHYLLYTEMP